jgi:hypothetical protein
MAKGRGRGSGARGSRLGPHRRVSGDEAAGRRGGAVGVSSSTREEERMVVWGEVR